MLSCSTSTLTVLEFLCVKSAFYEGLAEELTDNRYDSVKRRLSDSSGDSEQSGDDKPSAGIGTPLAETYKKRRIADGSFSKASDQGHCRSCKKFKSKLLCSKCRDNGLGDIFLCHAGTKRICFSSHLKEKHYIELMEKRPSLVGCPL